MYVCIMGSDLRLGLKRTFACERDWPIVMWTWDDKSVHCGEYVLMGTKYPGQIAAWDHMRCNSWVNLNFLGHLMWGVVYHPASSLF